jgi:hypothetical protein
MPNVLGGRVARVAAFRDPCGEDGEPDWWRPKTPPEGSTVARIIEAARRAVPRPDLDEAEWAGEAEDLAPTATADFGDEREHDAWIAGTPAAELRKRR